MNFQSKNIDDEIDINLTPLIDIVFLLLIFFMVSTTFVNSSSIDVSLPESSAKTAPKETKTPTVSVNANDEIYLDGKRSNLEELATFFSGKNELIVKADKKASHGIVVKILDLAKEKGISGLNIATQKKVSSN